MEAAPSSAALCPACGKAVDPLRAGHVAIMGGGFRYFCDAKCKSDYVEVTSKRLTLDAMTAEPPSVTASSGVREKDQEPAFPPVADPIDDAGDGEESDDA